MSYVESSSSSLRCSFLPRPSRQPSESNIVLRNAFYSSVQQLEEEEEERRSLGELESSFGALFVVSRSFRRFADFSSSEFDSAPLKVRRAIFSSGVRFRRFRYEEKRVFLCSEGKSNCTDDSSEAIGDNFDVSFVTTIVGRIKTDFSALNVGLLGNSVLPGRAFSARTRINRNRKFDERRH